MIMTDMYPWLGSHGSIEGGAAGRVLSIRYARIHGWEVMAPLKALLRKNQQVMDNRIHGWEVMAPLKAAGDSHCARNAVAGIHGWEVMAPLKALSVIVNSILHLVSMAGKSWLH